MAFVLFDSLEDTTYHIHFISFRFTACGFFRASSQQSRRKPVTRWGMEKKPLARWNIPANFSRHLQCLFAPRIAIVFRYSIPILLVVIVDVFVVAVLAVVVVVMRHMKLWRGFVVCAQANFSLYHSNTYMFWGTHKKRRSKINSKWTRTHTCQKKEEREKCPLGVPCVTQRKCVACYTVLCTL